VASALPPSALFRQGRSTRSPSITASSPVHRRSARPPNAAAQKLLRRIRAGSLDAPEDGRNPRTPHWRPLRPQSISLVANHGVWEAQDAPIATMSRYSVAHHAGPSNLDSVFRPHPDRSRSDAANRRGPAPQPRNAGNIVPRQLHRRPARAKPSTPTTPPAKEPLSSMTKGLATRARSARHPRQLRRARLGSGPICRAADARRWPTASRRVPVVDSARSTRRPARNRRPLSCFCARRLLAL